MQIDHALARAFDISCTRWEKTVDQRDATLPYSHENAGSPMPTIRRLGHGVIAATQLVPVVVTGALFSQVAPDDRSVYDGASVPDLRSIARAMSQR